jgi:dihydropteroate synthase
MQSPENLVYGDIFREISDFLMAAAEKAVAAGVRREAVALDPGFGFSKSFEQNISLAAGFHRFKELGFPLLAGVSRKAFIGALTGVKDPARRMPGSVAAALRLAAAGADILRVHDVPETVQALKVFSALSPEWRMKSEE